MPSVTGTVQHSDLFVPPEAPVFRPTSEEFEHPLRYIASIRPTAEAYGICKVIPPAGWKPPYVIDRAAFRFKTRIQSVHELQDRPDTQEAADLFQEEFEAFLQSTGRPVKKAPVFGGTPIDLSRLYKAVLRRGGYELVTQNKSWRDVGRILQLEDKSNNAAYTLRQVYQKHLLAFEEYDREREDSADASQGPLGHAGLAPSKRLSEPRDDAEEAADILNAIMGLSSFPQEQAPPRKRAKSLGVESETASQASDRIRVPDNIFTLNCELCKGGHHEEKIILCDRCDRGCHLFCLSPPLEQVPEGEWLCPLCKAEDAHGFIEGQQYNLDEFEKTAATFKKNFFGGQAAAKKASLEAIEAEFWKVVEEAEDPVEVLYGADIDTTITGSGFPQKGSSNSPYAEHGWNLNNLPKLDGTYGSMLRHIEENIPGVVVPWMYIGMMFSSFCWHIEDHMFYSINYHHWGDAKKWYGVPGSAGHLFEEAFRKALPGHFERQPDLLFHLTTLLSPRILHKYDVPVYSATQHEGEFVITFPNAYHGGFNMGFNCAEAVNFAPADWFRFGSAGTERFRTFRKPSVVSHEGLLLKVAETDDSPETCFWAKQDLQRVIAEERQWRCKLWSTGVKRSRRTDALKGFHKDDKDEAECAICHLYLHVSGLECDCCPGRRVCLHHANNLCECDPTRWRLVYRYSLEDLDHVLKQVCSHVPGEGSDIRCTSSYLGVTPVALTNADATANEATQGAPITGPGLAGPSPPSSHIPPASAPSLKSEAAQAPEQVASFASSSAQQSDRPANGIVKMEEADHASPSGDESEQTGRGRKRRRRGKDKKAVQPVRSYPTRERAKAEAEVEAEAEVLDAFSALAELADLAEANPEQSEQSNDLEPSKKRHKSSSIADRASEAPSSRDLHSADKADGAGTSASHMASLMSESQSLSDKLERQCQQWSQQLQQQRASWSLRCDHILTQGGVKVSELDSATAESEQYLWGDNDTASVKSIAAQLLDAKAWVARVYAFTKNKPTLEALKPIIQREPAPCSMPAFTKLREAFQQAEAWLVRAAEPLADKPTELKVLETLCSEASRIPINLPEAKGLRETMNAARKLAESLRNLLPTNREAGRVRRKGEEPVDIESLRAMKAQVLALHVTMPELTTLVAALDRLEDFQQRAKECLRTRPALATLQAMEKEAASLPAAVPETEGLTALVQKAEEWKAKAAALAAQKAPLKKMREVLHLGLRMPVEVPQVESLRAEIRRREWEETAKKAVTGRTTLSSLLEMLADAVAMGAGKSDLMDKLQSRADAAHAFEAKAAPCLATVEASTAATSTQPADTDIVVSTDLVDKGPAASTSMVDTASAPAKKVSLAELEALVQEGQGIGIKLDSLTDLTRLLNTARAWTQQAEFCLTGKEPQTAKNRKHHQRPSLEKATSLVDELPSMAVTLPHAEELCNKQQQALKWVDKARQVLEQGNLGQHLTDVQAVVGEGTAFGLEMPELTQLDALVKAIQWNGKVRAALRLKTDDPAQMAMVASSHQVGEAQHSATSRGSPAAAEAPLDPPATSSIIPPTAHTTNHLPYAPKLQTGFDNNPASSRQAEADSAAQPGNSGQIGGMKQTQLTNGFGVIPLAERLSLAEAEELFEQGGELPVEPSLLQRLQMLMEAGLQWEAQVAALLPGEVQGSVEAGSSSNGVSVGKLQQLLALGLTIELRLESLETLQTILREHSTWELHMKQVLEGGGKPTYSELVELQSQGRASSIRSSLVHELDFVLSVTQHWLHRCTAVMARRSAQSLNCCLEAMAASVQRAQEQMEAQLRKLQEERSQGQKGQQADPNAAGPGGSSYEENEQELLCVCQQPYNVDTAMISCDVCEDWYHLRCVGMTQTAAKSMKKYTCPVCVALKGNAEPLDAALAKNWKTLRPGRNDVAQLLVEASTLPCVLEEQHQIVCLLAAYDRWLGSVETIARGHEASVRIAMQGHHAAAAAARLPVATLSQMLKSALSVELDTRQVSQRLMRLIKADRWHMKAEQILRSHAKPTVDTLVKVLKEAETAELVVEQDPIGAILSQRAAAGKRWQDQARILMANLKEHAERPEVVQQVIADAQVLVQQAQQLDVRLDKDVIKLQESAKIYCLCRQPYDELRPMLSCDHCNDWFHYDCIGLQPPGDNEDDDEVAPAEYRCPKCCIQAGMQYALMHKLPSKSLHQLHQLTASASLHSQPYQQQYPHHSTQHLAPHSQAAASASHQAHQYPAHVQGLASAHSSHTQNLQGFHHAAAHAQQQMHLQQPPGHVQHYGAGQYPAASVPLPDDTGAEPQGGAAGEVAVRQDSIEPGDDWIEQAFAEPSHQAGTTVAAPNDQEAAFQLSAPAAQQQHADGSAVAVAQQAPASREDGQGLAASQHAGGMADVAVHSAEESNTQQAAGKNVDAAPQAGDDQFHVSSPDFDDNPANPDGKLMSLLMG